MNRARLISVLLGLILVACAAVIYLDQQGQFGNTSVGTPSAPVTTPAPTTPAPANPSSGSGYGDLK